MVETGDRATHDMSVYDAGGKRVLIRNVATPTVLDITALKSGSYILQVEYPNGERREAKFVKYGD